MQKITINFQHSRGITLNLTVKETAANYFDIKAQIDALVDRVTNDPEDRTGVNE